MRIALPWLSIIATLSIASTTATEITDNDSIELTTAALDPTSNLGPPIHSHSPTETPPTASTNDTLSTTSTSPTTRPSIDPQRRNGLFLVHPAVPATLDPDKHFHEATFDNHYDGRFASGPIDYGERHRILHNLIVTYLDSMREIGVETWLMHGTLLGWWWGQRILAWDFDVDVQMTSESLGFVGHYYNMSLWNFDKEGKRNDGGGTMALPSDDLSCRNETERENGFGKNGRTYLLEINPFHTLHDGGEKSDKNVIDGRWIDTSTGLYVDITCLWKAVDHEAGSGILTGKDGHSFREKYIFPLRETTFEGVEALIPNAYMEVLSKEYGPMALVNGHYKG